LARPEHKMNEPIQAPLGSELQHLGKQNIRNRDEFGRILRENVEIVLGEQYSFDVWK